MIYIFSSYLKHGGSTHAHEMLRGALCRRGIETYFGKAFIPENVSTSDRFILHFFPETALLKASDTFRPDNVFISCHESDLYIITPKILESVSKIHFLSDWQREYHRGYTDIPDSKSFILPNVMTDLSGCYKRCDGLRVGGVIGSIDRNKQVHKSIIRALNDGCDLVYIWGDITDQSYYSEFVEELIDGLKVIHRGYEEDIKKIYCEVTDVYQDSQKETWGYIAGECQELGIPYHGVGSVNFHYMKEHEIVNGWLSNLGLNGDGL